MKESELLRLYRAKASIESAYAEIGRVWEGDRESRTPRMAEAISLIDRGLRKLDKEIKEHETKGSGK